MYNQDNILYTPKVFKRNDLKDLITRNLAHLTLEQLSIPFQTYQSIISLFGIECIMLGDNVYIKPATFYRECCEHSFMEKCFGKFDIKKALPNECTCKIFIDEAKIQDSLIRELMFFMESASKSCRCGRKINHYHCLICGNRTSYNKPLFNFKHDTIVVADTLLDDALKKLEGRLYCSNCVERTFSEDIEITLHQIPALLSRIKPGQVLPEGQCTCGGLLYKNEKDIPEDE